MLLAHTNRMTEYLKHFTEEEVDSQTLRKQIRSMLWHK
jgi:hypothetical protein